MPVAFDVAVLAADHEQHELFVVARIREPAWRRRLDVDECAGADLPLLAADLGARATAVHEVELVLFVVVVQEALEPRRVDDPVHAERGHAELATNLAEAGALAELVQM